MARGRRCMALVPLDRRIGLLGFKVHQSAGVELSRPWSLQKHVGCNIVSAKSSLTSASQQPMFGPQ